MTCSDKYHISLHNIYAHIGDYNTQSSFISGDKVYLSLHNILSSASKNNITKDTPLCFYIPGLRMVHFKYTDDLSTDQKNLLTYYITNTLPLKHKKQDNMEIETFQFTDLSVNFDFIVIKLGDFVKTVNEKQILFLGTIGNRVAVVLSYKPFDFWNENLGKMIDYIKL